MSGAKVLAMRSGAALEVREATTGRVVAMLPRVWAVGIEAPETVAGSHASRKETRDEWATPDAGETGREVLPVAEAEVAFYRKYTEALLRRYQRLSRQAGRVPSPMDREVFRGRMSHFKVQGFDDAVIFCVDVEKCLGRLNEADQRLVRRIAVQEYTMGEAAGVLGLSLRSCCWRSAGAL